VAIAFMPVIRSRFRLSRKRYSSKSSNFLAGLPALANQRLQPTGANSAYGTQMAIAGRFRVALKPRSRATGEARGKIADDVRSGYPAPSLMYFLRSGNSCHRRAL
jgi:hypothetical protein